MHIDIKDVQNQVGRGVFRKEHLLVEFASSEISPKLLVWVKAVVSAVVHLNYNFMVITVCAETTVSFMKQTILHKIISLPRK